MRRLTIVVSVVALFTAMVAAPATAVVDELYAAWCSGQPNTPPGLVKDPAFARPVIASGLVQIHGPHNHLGTTGNGMHVTFNTNRPNAKIVETGPIFNDGTDLEPFYVNEFTLNPDFPAFQNCPNIVFPFFP